MTGPAPARHDTPLALACQGDGPPSAERIPGNSARTSVLVDSVTLVLPRDSNSLALRTGPFSRDGVLTRTRLSPAHCNRYNIRHPAIGLKLQQQSNPASPSGHRTQSSGFSFAFLTSQLFSKWFCMPYLLGIDEAGYAPNLGPLVVGASSWRTPTTDCDLYQLLESALSATSVEGKIAIADSKELHTTDSLLRLEQNLWAVCPQFQQATSGSLSDLLRACSPDLPLQKLVALEFRRSTTQPASAVGSSRGTRTVRFVSASRCDTGLSSRADCCFSGILC